MVYSILPVFGGFGVYLFVSWKATQILIPSQYSMQIHDFPMTICFDLHDEHKQTAQVKYFKICTFNQHRNKSVRCIYLPQCLHFYSCQVEANESTHTALPEDF